MANGFRPQLPGVGTQSRIADVQIAQSRLSQDQEAMNRRSGAALLGLLANTGINVADLIQRARQAAAQREFQRGERLEGQEFRAGQSKLFRDLQERQLGLQESRDIQAAAQAEDAAARAARGLDLEEDRLSIERQRAESEAQFRTDQLKQQEAELGRVPQEQFDRTVRETVSAVIANVTDPERATPPEQVQPLIDEALNTLARNFPEQAANNAAIQASQARAAAQPAGPVPPPDPFVERGRLMEEEFQRRQETARRAVERQNRIRSINQLFESGQLPADEALRQLRLMGARPSIFSRLGSPNLSPEQASIIMQP